jgi:hypothetical protein
MKTDERIIRSLEEEASICHSYTLAASESPILRADNSAGLG